MTRGDSEQKSGDDHQRSKTSGGAGAAGAAGGAGMASHPPDLNPAHITNVDKLEMDLKSPHPEPVEQHRSSRRPRERRQHKPH